MQVTVCDLCGRPQKPGETYSVVPVNGTEQEACPVCVGKIQKAMDAAISRIKNPKKRAKKSAPVTEVKG